MINYKNTAHFDKDFKKLLKRFRTLNDDFENLKKYSIELFYSNGIDNNSIFSIPDCCSEKIQICKIKKIACKSLMGRGSQSGLRIIYAYFINTNTIEFIEIYFKADQESEDREKIKEYLKTQNNS